MPTRSKAFILFINVPSKHWIGISWYPETSSVHRFCLFPNFMAPYPSRSTLHRFLVAALSREHKLMLKRCSEITYQPQRPDVQHRSQYSSQCRSQQVFRGPGKKSISLPFPPGSHPYPMNMLNLLFHLFLSRLQSMVLLFPLMRTSD